MRVNWKHYLISAAPALFIVCHALSQSINAGLSITCDTSCVVAIDGKLVGRLSAGQQRLFEITVGKHVVAGANEQGAYWEKQIDFDGSSSLAVSVPLLKAAAERAQLESDVKALRGEVTQKRTQLESAQKQSEQLASSTELMRAARQRIVQAIEWYAERATREAQLGNSRKDQADGLNPHGASPGDIFGNIASGRLYGQAGRNFMSANAAQARMNELAVMLQGPVIDPKEPEQTDYRIITHNVFKGSRGGVLVSGDGWIEYRESVEQGKKSRNSPHGSRTLRLSCEEIRDANTSGLPLLRDINESAGSRSLTIKLTKGSLKLKAGSAGEQQAVIGSVYLACPTLTQ
jgi:hypothetical protein